MEDLINKIEKYIELEEKIDVLDGKLHSLVGLVFLKRNLYNLDKLDTDSGVFYRNIIEQIDSLNGEERDNLYNCLYQKKTQIEKELIEFYYAEKMKSEKRLSRSEARKKSKRLYHYQAFLVYVGAYQKGNSLNYACYDD